MRARICVHADVLCAEALLLGAQAPQTTARVEQSLGAALTAIGERASERFLPLQDAHTGFTHAYLTRQGNDRDYRGSHVPHGGRRGSRGE